MPLLVPGVRLRCTRLSPTLCVHFYDTPLCPCTLFTQSLLCRVCTFLPSGFLSLPLLPLLFLCLLLPPSLFLSPISMSAAVSPNSNLVGVYVGISIFFTLLAFLGLIFLFKSNVCEKTKAYQQVYPTCISTLNPSLFGESKSFILNAARSNLSDARFQMMHYTKQLTLPCPTHFPVCLLL